MRFELVSVNDKTVRRIIRRESHGDLISDNDLDIKLSHPTREFGVNALTVCELYGVVSAGQHIRDHAVNLN